MGQFDLETDAALAQINWEEVSKAPGQELAEIIGDLLMLVGTGGVLAIAGGASNLALKVRRLAGAGYASNLIYTITAVRNDLATLYDRHESLRSRIDSLPADPKFAEAISALALRAMHTSVGDRLRRLARIVVNGVRDGDLEPESLDDMMRAAVELKDDDIRALDRLCEEQADILATTGKTHGDLWPDEVRRNWQTHIFDHKIPGRSGQHYLDWRSSLARLSAFGFLIPVQPVQTVNSPGHEPYGASLQGVEFLKRLKEAE